MAAIDLLPLKRMKERLELARADSDSAFFHDLLLYGELTAKLATAALVASIVDEPARHRYGQAYRLVRADGVGDWAAVASEVITGPASQFVVSGAADIHRELNQRVDESSWQHRAVAQLHACLNKLGVPTQTPAKIQGKAWLADFATVRNKTRGHGAHLRGVMSEIAPLLEESTDLFASSFTALRLPWAHLHRNLSGKYRVSPMSADASAFSYLTRADDVSLRDGVYVALSEPARVELAFSDADLTDFFLPNGAFNGKRFESLSYITGNTVERDAAQYLVPASDLPASTTQGLGELQLVGDVFTNLPPTAADYVRRSKPEDDLLKVLADDRHPMVTLVGPGGTGKTSLALEVLHRVAERHCFDLVVWFSARDVDLLPSGPKPVRAHVNTPKEIANEYARLLGTRGRVEKTFDAVAGMAADLTRSSQGSTLFVFDNFETVASPTDIYAWLDTYVRLPNKVLITTRTRDFKGDYPIDVKGMTREESAALIDVTAGTLGIKPMMTQEYKDALYQESEGHPYVIKILLGEALKAGRPTKPERIVADKEEILTALFERTYLALTPAARRVFLTLCGWRSLVPAVAVKAVLLRPSNERFDVDSALEELERSSLVQIARSSRDHELFLQVPLAAAVFGRNKLRVDAARISVESDLDMLRMFGASLETDVNRGLEPRIRRLFNEVSRRLEHAEGTIAEFEPVLEFLARAYSPAWLLVADLIEERAGEPAKVKRALTSFLESSDPDATDDRRIAWKRLADIAAQEGDSLGELHAVVELAQVDPTPSTLSYAANRVNSRLREGAPGVARDERSILLRRLADTMQSHVQELDGTALSRLAWLCLSLHDEAAARRHTALGLQREPGNPHLEKLAQKLQLR